MPSIVAAKHGFSCVVTENDPRVLPLLEANLERNLPRDVLESEKVRVQSLNWGDDDDCARVVDGLHPDLVVVSDVIYKDTRPSWSALATLLGRLKRSSNNDEHPLKRRRLDGRAATADDGPLILLGYTHRSRNLSAEERREFFRLLDREGLAAHLIPHDDIPNSEERILTNIFELRRREA